MNVDEPIFFPTGAAFEAWLEANHDSADEIWVKIAKKATGVTSIDWKAGVEAALCFGWIDGKARRIDDDWYQQRFTPRRKRSLWSKLNTIKAEALIASGRMRPAGLAEVDRAKADGRWDAAYEGSATATIPEDLRTALAANALEQRFADLDAGNRFAIIHQIRTATRAETRARRIDKYVAMLKAGDEPHP